MRVTMRVTRIEGVDFIVAKDVFKLFGIVYNGESSLLKRNIKKEWIKRDMFKTSHGTKETLLINEIAVLKLSAYGSNKEANNYWNEKTKQ